MTIGTFESGQAFNVIADEARLSGTVRTFNPDTQTRIMEDMERIIATTCAGAGADYELNYIQGYPAVINHPMETTHVRHSAVNVVGSAGVIEMSPLMVGEDFAYYLQHVPGSFFFAGAGNPERDAIFPHHHPRFDIDERAMLLMARILMNAAFETWEETKEE